MGAGALRLVKLSNENIRGGFPILKRIEFQTSVLTV